MAPVQLQAPTPAAPQVMVVAPTQKAASGGKGGLIAPGRA
jgi:hypothetical protein